MAAVALIGFTQVGTIVVPIYGRARTVSATGGAIGAVAVSNESSTDVLSWRVELLFAPIGSAYSPTPGNPVILAQNPNGSLVAATFDVAAALPGTYRVRVTVWDQIGYAGNSDVDIRCAVLLTPTLLMVIPPYQHNPDPLDDSAGKPNELNLEAQPFGWSGRSFAVDLARLLNPALKALDDLAAVVGTHYAQLVTVSKLGGGDFTEIADAVASITDAAAGKRYVVLVYPGAYTSRVVMKPYVDVIGQSRHAVTLSSSSANGAVKMANETLLQNLLILSTTNTTDWGIEVDSCVGFQIRCVDILAPMPPSPTQLAQGIHIFGTFQTGFVSDCIINYVGETGWGILVEGNPAAPQNSDLHLERCFVDAYYATTGGCVKIKDCYGTLIDGGKFRTTATGTALLTQRTTGTVDAGLLGGALFLAPLTANVHVVDLGASTKLHLWSAWYQSIRQAGANSVIIHYDRTGNWRVLPSTAAGYVWTNQGLSTVVVNPDGSLLITQPKRVAAGGPSVSVYQRITTSPPYDWIGQIWPCHATQQNLQSGLCWRESSSGKLVLVGYQIGFLFIAKYDSPTVLNSWYFSQPWSIGGPIWLRLRDTGVNREVYVSPDGWNWQGIHSIGRTDFMTADRVGIWVDANTLNPADPILDVQLLVRSLQLI